MSPTAQHSAAQPRRSPELGEQGEGGFTLLELLVVVGLIAALSFVLIGGLQGGGKSAALQSGQATLVNVITAARTKAGATGCRVRVLINADTSDVARFRRTLVLQQETALNSNIWNDPVLVTTLPEGIYVLPYRNRIPPGFYDNQGGWTKYGSSAQLESSALSNAPVSVAISSPASGPWDLIQFTPAGTLSFGTGDMVLAAGHPRPPGSYLAGESPVQVANPGGVRGITISTYGTPVLVNSRMGF